MDDLDASLLKQKSLVAVSGYPGEHQQLEAAGWLRHEMTTMTTIHTGNSRGERVECLWTNYDPDDFGHLRLF